MVKNLPASVGDARYACFIPGLGRSPAEGNGNPLQCSCLENSWTEEPSGLQSTGSQRVGHHRVTEPHREPKQCCEYDKVELGMYATLLSILASVG